MSGGCEGRGRLGPEIDRGVVNGRAGCCGAEVVLRAPRPVPLPGARNAWSGESAGPGGLRERVLAKLEDLDLADTSDEAPDITALMGRGSADILDTGEVDGLPLLDVWLCEDLPLCVSDCRPSMEGGRISLDNRAVRFWLGGCLETVCVDDTGEMGGGGDDTCDALDETGLGRRVGVAGLLALRRAAGGAGGWSGVAASWIRGEGSADALFGALGVAAKLGASCGLGDGEAGGESPASPSTGCRAGGGVATVAGVGVAVALALSAAACARLAAIMALIAELARGLGEGRTAAGVVRPPLPCFCKLARSSCFRAVPSNPARILAAGCGKTRSKAQ